MTGTCGIDNMKILFPYFNKSNSSKAKNHKVNNDAKIILNWKVDIKIPLLSLSFKVYWRIIAIFAVPYLCGIYEEHFFFNPYLNRLYKSLLTDNSCWK